MRVRAEKQRKKLEFGVWSLRLGVVWYIQSKLHRTLVIHVDVFILLPDPDVHQIRCFTMRTGNQSSPGLCCEGSSDLQMVRRRVSKRIRRKERNKKFGCSPIFSLV